MRTLTVPLPGREYDIVIQPKLLDEAGERIRAVCPDAQRLYVVTDSNVAVHYAAPLLDNLAAAGFERRMHIIPAGEQSKNATRLSELWEGMLSFGLTRTDAVVALGGGVVGDLTGFAASTVLRGVDLIQIPTTLLSQVDSSVGGKTAIDLKAGKNLAGTFWQPRLVLMDPKTLDTLDDRTFFEGMAEVVKYGCISDEMFFEFLETSHSRRALMEKIEYILFVCCDSKRKVVVRDERDTGARMILNFGHTLGHAYERAGGYKTWTHGQAVAAGMCLAAKLGVQMGVTPPDVPARIETLCAALGLPTRIDCEEADYSAAVGHDKKGAGEDISVVLLDRIGHAVIRRLPREELLERLNDLLYGG